MQWKQILSTSSLMGLIIFVVLSAEDYLTASQPLFMEPFYLVSFLIGVAGTGIILNKKLSAKESLGIPFGMFITFLTPFVLDTLLWVFDSVFLGA